MLLDIILNYLNSLLKNKDKTIKTITKNVENIIKDENKGLINNFSNLQSEYNNLTNSKKNRMLMFDKGIINLEELDEELKHINDKVSKIETSLKKIENNELLNLDIEKIIKDYFKDLDKIINEKDITNKMLKRVIEKIVVTPKKELKIYLKSNKNNYSNLDLSLNKIIPDTNIGTYRGNKME